MACPTGLPSPFHALVPRLHRETQQEILEWIAALPRKWCCSEELAHFYHTDLIHGRRTRGDMERELARIKLRLLLDDEPDDWFLERAKVLEEALDGR